MGTLGNLTIKIALMIALGFFLKKRHIITDEFQKDLSNLLLNVILPINVLASSSSECSKDIMQGIIISTLIACIYYIAALFISKQIGKRTKMSDRGQHIFVMMCVFANVGFIGYPLIQELYGKSGFILAVVYNLIYQIFLVTVGIKGLDSEKDRNGKGFWKDPLCIISVLSILIFISPFRLPDVLQDTCNTLGDLMVPISMILIGCDLARENMKLIFRDGRSYVVAVLRLLIFPVLMLAVLKLLRTDNMILAPMVVLTALPSGSLNVILAQKYQCEPEFAARTVLLTMELMIPTIPLILFLISL
jgi:Predicted permeases